VGCSKPPPGPQSWHTFYKPALRIVLVVVLVIVLELASFDYDYEDDDEDDALRVCRRVTSLGPAAPA